MNKISKRKGFEVYTWGDKPGRNPNDLIGFKQKEHKYIYCTVCDKLLPEIFYEIDKTALTDWWLVCSEECITMCILQNI